MLMTRLEFPEPAEFVAPIVALVEPTTRGVPTITPVTLLTPKPLGSPLALKLVGELLAAIW